MPVIVVTGGAGYVGSVVVHELCALSYQVIVLDTKPLPQALQKNRAVVWCQGNYGDAAVWKRIREKYPCDAVIHLAASIEVAESVVDPLGYYHNNVGNVISMLQALRDMPLRCLIAASSSAVYGNPLTVPIAESHPRNPLSPYGRTKVMLEDILTDFQAAYGVKVGLLRFANVAGALPEARLGECHEPETHLIPRALRALHESTEFLVRGTDYATPDGTCLRDFVHVHDVARLHASLLGFLCTHDVAQPLIFNVGSGRASSVSQVLATVEQVTHRTLRRTEMPRRPGDASAIVLDIAAARNVLSWQPERSDLATIIRDAYAFCLSLAL